MKMKTYNPSPSPGLLILDDAETVVRPKNGSFIDGYENILVIPEAKDGIAAAKSRGLKVAIASNQGGVAAGKKSIRAASEEMMALWLRIPQVDLVMFCPDYEGRFLYSYYYDADGVSQFKEVLRDGLSFPMAKQYGGVGGGYASFRKPGAGMVQWAMNHFNAYEACCVGDRPEDQAAAENARVSFLHSSRWHKACSLDSASATEEIRQLCLIPGAPGRWTV